MSSSDYYDDKIEFKKKIKTHKSRCVIIESHKDNTIENQIKDFIKLGFRNIIVQKKRKNKGDSMYNVVNFRKYLHDNKEILIKLIKEENNYECENWESDIQHDDCIFYSQNLLLTNFLKWCCV